MHFEAHLPRLHRPSSQRLIRDVNLVTSVTVAGIGVCAGGLVVLFTYFARFAYGSQLDFSALIGSFITGRTDETTLWIGFAGFIALSCLSAFGYAFIFWSAHRSGAAIGINLSFFHWLIAGFSVGVLPAFHPLIPSVIPAPGFFMIETGFATSVTFFLAHVIFGAVVGMIFDWAAQRDDYPRPITAIRDPMFERPV